ncbi:DUF2243 domain-containing protein [Roseivivax marinus]|uniref:DUF2243 domain-containing protein n=1 Tax=Roseivivax marinus TaxID=1379903 RepID=UPI00273FF8CF|nr:DUF2243 domain-containing protein [Roseivivax marinus]
MIHPRTREGPKHATDIPPATFYGLILGFGLGGFFDGILLHQILQWHHLLSLVPNVDDLRLQVLWDGLFHALMYVIVAIELWGLWRTHRNREEILRSALFGALLMGAGTWHVIDRILAHWVLGIHRIKIDAAEPLVWDLAWFVVFGLGSIVAGWVLHKRGGPGGGSKRQRALLLALTVSSAGAGIWAMQPPNDQRFTTAVFRPGQNRAEVFASLDATDARLVWTDRAMGVVVVDVAESNRWTFYRHGALLVSGSGLPSGCFGWSAA